MSKKTRYFVLTAGVILALGLTTGLVASYMGMPVSVLSEAAGPEDLQYVPADAAVVAYANVREVMSSTFRERFRQFEPDTSERDEFEQKTGINIDHDIESVVAAFMTPAEGTTNWRPQGGVLVLARGRFEPARLEALAIEHGARVEDYQGKKLLTHVEDAGNTEMALGFIDVDLVAFGSSATVKRAIDARGGNNVLSNAEMMRHIEQLDASNTWAVGRFDQIARSASFPAEVQAHVPAIQYFSAATHINGGVSGVVKAEAKDDESAKNLREIVQGFLALAKMQSASRPEIKTVVDSLLVSGEGKTVSLSFSVPSQLFDALEALGKQHQQQGDAPRR